MVPNLHGICINCGEKSLECQLCQSINYDKPDAFLCNECGHSRYGKIDISLTARMGFATKAVGTEKDRNAIQNTLSGLMSNAMKSHEALMGFREKLCSYTDDSLRNVEEKPIGIYDFYMSTCAPEYSSLVKQLKSINAVKSELIQYALTGAVSTDSAKIEPSSSCYGCAEVFLQIFLKFVELSAFLPFCAKYYTTCNTHSIILGNILNSPSRNIDEYAFRSLVSLFIQNSSFSAMICERLSTCISPMKDSKLALEGFVNTTFAIKLLIKAHSTLMLLTIAPGSPYRKEQTEALMKINSTIINMIKQTLTSSDSKIAETIVVPLFEYLEEALSISQHQELVWLSFYFIRNWL